MSRGCLSLEIRLTYESASPMRYCEGIYLVKVKISFKLALDTQHLENLTIQKQRYYTTRKLEKSNAQGYIWGKLESTTTQPRLDLETVQESIRSGTLTQEPNDQLGTHDLEMQDHPSETWESFNRRDRLSDQQSEVWTDLCATSRSIGRIREIQSY